MGRRHNNQPRLHSISNYNSLCNRYNYPSNSRCCLRCACLDFHNKYSNSKQYLLQREMFVTW